MIKINLAEKKQASYAGGKNAGGLSGQGGSLLSSFSESGAGALLTKMGVPLLLMVAVYFGSEYYMSQKIEEMETEVTTIGKEKTRLETELTRIKGFEVVKAELEKNSHFLQTKIETIEKLVRGRDFTVKSLVAISQALPKEVWLASVLTTDTAYDIKGSSLDIAFVSDLMSHLGQSIYFKEVQLKNSSLDANGIQSNFEITARRD